MIKSTEAPGDRESDAKIKCLLKKLNMGLLYDPAIPLLGIHPKEIKSLPGDDICTLKFIPALFIAAKI